MIRFAYPNVDAAEGQFLGCGRYLYLPSGQQPLAGYTEVTAPPTPNLAAIRAPVTRLVRQPLQSAGRIYESRDQPVPYQGTSLDLAYYLALIHQTWQLRIESPDTASDIWCTGAIECQNGPGRLQAVEAPAFDLKLEAFLADHNHDTLFLVPRANLAPHHVHLCAQHATRTVTCAEFKKLVRGSLAAAFEQKTVVAIERDELEPFVVYVLFATPRVVRWSASLAARAGHWSAQLAVLALSAGVVIWLVLSPPKPVGPVTPRLPAPSQPGSNVETRLAITDPGQDGSEVGQGTAVQGTAVLPSAQHLWVLVHRRQGFANAWWPQGEGQVEPGTHRWRVNVTFGVPQDVGYEFEIAVITVNEDVHQDLQRRQRTPPIPLPPTTFPAHYRTVKKVSHE